MISWHAEPAWMTAPFETLTPEQRVAVIIERDDNNRIDWNGGYPSEYIIDNDRVIWATLSSSKEYRQPLLVIQPIADFIEEHQWIFDDEAP